MQMAGGWQQQQPASCFLEGVLCDPEWLDSRVENKRKEPVYYFFLYLVSFILFGLIIILKVKVTIKDPGSAQEEYIRSLERGDFFGEKALQGYNV